MVCTQYIKPPEPHRVKLLVQFLQTDVALKYYYAYS
jgi:hypothetical protein